MTLLTLLCAPLSVFLLERRYNDCFKLLREALAPFAKSTRVVWADVSDGFDDQPTFGPGGEGGGEECESWEEAAWEDWGGKSG